MVGNGWCKGSTNQRIKDGKFSWQNVDIGIDHSAEECEYLCLGKPECIGYMTEDDTKCDIILSTDTNAAEGISHVDSERRNHCWIKHTQCRQHFFQQIVLE